MLFEVIVATAILAIAGAACVMFAAEAQGVVQRVNEREGQLRSANRFLEAVSLWTRADLERHLGNRPQGRWRLEIERETGNLFSVTLSDSTGATEIFHTTLYRVSPSVGAETPPSITTAEIP